jgi:biotin carboxyl carrier protein
MFVANVLRDDGKRRVRIEEEATGLKLKFEAEVGDDAILIDEQVHRLMRPGTELLVRHGGRQSTAIVEDRSRVERPSRRPPGALQRVVCAPLPGRVVRVLCAVGSEVSPGDRLVVIEAMKMQNPIFSEYHGRVTRVSVQDGQAVNTGEALVHVDEAP